MGLLIWQQRLALTVSAVTMMTALCTWTVAIMVTAPIITDGKEVNEMEKFKAFIMSTEFVSGLIIGFTLGALHHYMGL